MSGDSPNQAGPASKGTCCSEEEHRGYNRKERAHTGQQGAEAWEAHGRATDLQAGPPPRPCTGASPASGACPPTPDTWLTPARTATLGAGGLTRHRGHSAHSQQSGAANFPPGPVIYRTHGRLSPGPGNQQLPACGHRRALRRCRTHPANRDSSGPPPASPSRHSCSRLSKQVRSPSRDALLPVHPEPPAQTPRSARTAQRPPQGTQGPGRRPRPGGARAPLRGSTNKRKPRRTSRVGRARTGRDGLPVPGALRAGGWGRASLGAPRGNQAEGAVPKAPAGLERGRRERGGPRAAVGGPGGQQEPELRCGLQGRGRGSRARKRVPARRRGLRGVQGRTYGALGLGRGSRGAGEGAGVPGERSADGGREAGGRRPTSLSGTHCGSSRPKGLPKARCSGTMRRPLGERTSFLASRRAATSEDMTPPQLSLAARTPAPPGAPPCPRG